MADANSFDSLFEGLELKDELKTELTGRLTKFKTEIDSGYSTKLTEAQSKLEEAINTRQKAKDRIKELEEKITKGDIDGLKEAKELANKYKADLDGLSESHNTLKEDYEKVSKKYGDTIANFKKGILDKIPDNLKPSEELLSKMSVEDLTNYRDGLVKQNVIVDKSTSIAPPNGKKKFDTLAKWKEQFQ